MARGGYGRTGGGKAAEEAALAFRLKHDVGKYVRWNAPEALEASTEALRERLKKDLLETRATAGGVLSVAQVWDSWRAEAAGVFEELDLAPVLDEIARSLARVETLLPRLHELARADLVSLDGETRLLARETARLHRIAASRTEGA